MEIKGVIKKMLDIESGISKAGKEWKKQSVLIERPNEQYNKEICVEAFGNDKIEKLNKFSEGDTITILANVFSREWNGKYFHSIQGYWFANKNTDMGIEEDNEDMPF
jgi:hypothetical protein